MCPPGCSTAHRVHGCSIVLCPPGSSTFLLVSGCLAGLCLPKFCTAQGSGVEGLKFRVVSTSKQHCLTMQESSSGCYPPGSNTVLGVGGCNIGLCSKWSSTVLGVGTQYNTVSNRGQHRPGSGEAQYSDVPTRRQHCPGGAVTDCVHPENLILWGCVSAVPDCVLQGAALTWKWVVAVSGCVHQKTALPKGSGVHSTDLCIPGGLTILVVGGRYAW